LENIWEQLTPQYLSELEGLVWKGSLPKPSEILIVMEKAKTFLEDYDKK
jgi:hypothetical protein